MGSYESDFARKMATAVAMAMLGRPYVWGGDDPVKGFDCSGLVIELLKTGGLLPREGDWRARDLYSKFKHNEISITQVDEGCLVFWTKGGELKSPNNIIHVEYAISNTLCIGASGGGSRTVSMQDAIEQNAYIKIRPFRSRGSDATRFYIDPFRDFVPDQS